MKNIIRSFLMFAMLSTLIYSCSSGFGKEKKFNGVQLFYTSKITEAQADKLGNYLVTGGFADGEYKTVQITKTGNTFEFRMIVKEGIEKDVEYIEVFKSFARELSQNVFNGEQVDIHLCNDKLKTLRVIIQSNLLNTTSSSETSLDKTTESTNSEALLPSDILADDDLEGKVISVKGVYLQMGQIGMIYDEAGSTSGIIVDIASMSKDEKKQIIKGCSQGCEINLKAKVINQSGTKKLNAIALD